MNVFDFLVNCVDKVNKAKSYIEIWYFLAMVLSSISIVLIIEKAKARTVINKITIFLETVMSTLIGYVFLVVFNGLTSLFMGMVIGPFASFFIYSKYIKKYIDNDADTITHLDMSISERGSIIPDRRDLSTNVLNLDDIENPDIYNLLDLMVLYNYISPNHRRKLYEESISLDTNDIDINKLLRIPVLTEEELKEIKNIQKIICMERRLLTMEEALKEIIKAKNRNRRDG